MPGIGIADLCIRRPVFASVLSLILLLVGAVSYQRLVIREYPKIDEPVATVSTRYQGASSEIVESQITKPLEDSIAGIDGVDILTSVSRPEESSITVRFRLDRDPDDAAADVRDRVSRVRFKLPQSIDEPVVAKVEADANPIIWIAFTSDSLDPMAISDHISRFVKPRLQTLPGAADVRISGERRYSMRIWLDPQRLASFQLTPADVEQALRRQNVDVPSGRIESQQREFTVVSMTDLRSSEQFADVIIKNVNQYSVRLRDVARVEMAPLDIRSIARFNGKPAVAAGLIKQATANPLVLSAALKAELPTLRAGLPAGMQMTVSSDASLFIERSIRSVYLTIAEAGALVALVIFLFLGTLRASLIPLVTIPVALISTFGLMYAAGFTINTLTLLALVLAIGLVVDDAIVVLENVYRHIEAGRSPMAAARIGSGEVGFAVVAMTLTLAAVYAPVAFTTGRTGRLFIEFALTLAGAVLVSGFIALTLTPMMCSRLLRHDQAPGPLARGIDAALRRLTSGYVASLTWSLRHRWLVLLLGGLVAAASVWLWITTPRELSPLEDRGGMMVAFSGPDGASLDYTRRHVLEIERQAGAIPEVDRNFLFSGWPSVSQGAAFLGLVDWDDRTRSVFDIQRVLQPGLQAIPGITAYTVVPSSLGAGYRDRSISFVILASESFEEIGKVVRAIEADLSAAGGLQAIDDDLRLNKPELRMTIDRDRAADAGVQIDAIGQAVETALGGRQVTRFKLNGEQYDVLVQFDATRRASPGDISDIFVRGRTNTMVPLSSLVTVREAVSARELNHFAQRRAVTISASLTQGTSLGEALEKVNTVVQKNLKPGYAIDYTGQSREFRLSATTLLVTFLLALAFIYLVLAAQFESFVDPMVIMLTVPLSITGALALLQWSGGSMNVYSQIGLITLIGLITKHGILIVEFANRILQRAEEASATVVDARAAVIEAAGLRLRPILMTTGAMVLGALPLAMARGAGAEGRVQIGLVIVGGLSLGTVLTLYVVPTVYSLLASGKARKMRDQPPSSMTRSFDASDHPRYRNHRTVGE